MSKRYRKRSIKHVTEAVDERLDSIAPAGAGVEQFARLFREEITILRNDGATCVDGGLNPRISGGALKVGTNFAVDLLAARRRVDRRLSTP